jgi:hypothetical protein
MHAIARDQGVGATLNRRREDRHVVGIAERRLLREFERRTLRFADHRDRRDGAFEHFSPSRRYFVAGGITTGASTGAPWIESSCRLTENWRTGDGASTGVLPVICDAALTGWAALRAVTRSCLSTGSFMPNPAPR